VVICLEQDADLHTAQLVPLPLTVSCFSKIQIGFTFLVPANPGVCVCVVCCLLYSRANSSMANSCKRTPKHICIITAVCVSDWWSGSSSSSSSSNSGSNGGSWGAEYYDERVCLFFCLSVCISVSVTGRSSIETGEWVEVIFAWELPSTYHTMCVKSKLAYLQKYGYFQTLDIKKVVLRRNRSSKLVVILTRQSGRSERDKLDVIGQLSYTLLSTVGASLSQWSSTRRALSTAPGPDLSVWRPWAGSLLEAPTHPQML